MWSDLWSDLNAANPVRLLHVIYRPCTSYVLTYTHMAAGVLAVAALSLSRAADECELPCPVPDALGARRPPREPVLPLPGHLPPKVEYSAGGMVGQVTQDTIPA